jgi:multiple sugar transport system substrate-binding protein
MTTNGKLFFYNKDIFEEVGWGADRIPKNLEEFEEINRLCIRKDGKGKLKRFGTLPDSLVLWGYIFGGSWYDAENHKVTANHPKNIEALKWLRNQAEKYDIKKLQRFQQSFGGWINSANCPLYVGKAAIYPSGEFFVTLADRYAPQLNYGWFPYPHPPGGRAECSIVKGSVFAIPSASKHKEEAWELLNFLTSPDSIKEFCLAIHNLPPLIDVANDPVFTKDPVYRDLARIMSSENVFGPPGIPVWIRYMEELQRAEEGVVYGNKDPEKTLNKVQEIIQRELDRLLKQKGMI